MSLLHINYFSQSLEKACGMDVVIPEAAMDKPLRVIYELHGLSDDYTMWQRRTSIERYADARSLMIVMPDGARSFYTDAKNGIGNYEKHILETVRFIDQMFKTVDSPEGRGIGGLSMGGYGAMKLGLKHPDIFGSIAAHSSVLDIPLSIQNKVWPEIDAIFGSECDPEDDCFALAAKSGPKPKIRFDCGVDDFLNDQNRHFHKHLTELGVPHEYEEFPGIHSWDYWDAHIEAALDFHLKYFAQ